MKWLYRILRLFFCPHSFRVREESPITRSHNGTVVGFFYTLECRHCGKLKSKKATL